MDHSASVPYFRITAGSPGLFDRFTDTYGFVCTIINYYTEFEGVAHRIDESDERCPQGNKMTHHTKTPCALYILH